MTTCHIKKISLIEHRQNSTPGASLNTTDMSLNNTNLESYKKALHNIVRRLNKTSSVTSKGQNRRSEVKLNQTQQFLYTTNNLHNAMGKKHYIASVCPTKTQVTPKRSLSNENSHYKTNKELLNKSMHDPYLRKDSLYTSISKSISTNKYEKVDSQPELDLTSQDKIAKNESKYTIEDPGLNTYVLQEVISNSPNNSKEERKKTKGSSQ